MHGKNKKREAGRKQEREISEIRDRGCWEKKYEFWELKRCGDTDTQVVNRGKKSSGTSCLY